MNVFESLSGYRIPQRNDELAELIQVFKDNNIQSYLEIGSRFGDSFYHITSAMPKESKAVCVDLVGGLWGRQDSKGYLEATCNRLVKEGYSVNCILGDSTDQAVIEQVNTKGPFDAVMIDGDHRFEGLFLDWINYGKFANKIVVFHDIDGWEHFEGRTGDKIEVPQIWNILKRRYPYKEIVCTDRGMGIGVLFVGE